MLTENDRICFLGDSITFGAGTTKRYFEYIAEKTGAEVVCVIGKKIVLYKKSTRKDFKHIEF